MVQGQSVIFCGCGHPIKNNRCKKHGTNWYPFGARPPKEKIGKYSGKSKNEEYGVNWR